MDLTNLTEIENLLVVNRGLLQLNRFLHIVVIKTYRVTLYPNVLMACGKVFSKTKQVKYATVAFALNSFVNVEAFQSL